MTDPRKRIMEAVKFNWGKAHDAYHIEQYKNQDDLFEDGAEFENDRLLPVIEILLAAIEVQQKALVQTNETLDQCYIVGCQIADDRKLINEKSLAEVEAILKKIGEP